MVQRYAQFFTLRGKRARDFCSLQYWLLSFSYRVAPKKCATIMLCSVGYLITNLCTVSLLFRIVHLFERHAKFSFGGLQVDPSSLGFILSSAFIVGCLLITASLFQYFARIQSISLARLVQERSTSMVLKSAAALPSQNAPEASAAMAQGRIQEIASLGARYTGMAVRLIGFAAPAAITLPVATIAVFYFEPVLSLILTTLGVAVLIAQYPANRMAFVASEAWRARRIPSERLLRSVIAKINSLPRAAIDTERLDRDLQNLVHAPVTRESNDAFEDRLRAIELGGLHFQLGGALILGVALAYIGVDISTNEADYARLVAFFAFLRILLSNAATLGRVTVSMGRMLGPIHQLRRFLMSASSSEVGTKRGEGERYLLSAKPLEQKRSAAIELSKGQRVALLVPAGYGRDVAATVAGALLPRSGGGVNVDLAHQIWVGVAENRNGDSSPSPSSEPIHLPTTGDLDAVIIDQQDVHRLTEATGAQPIIFICYRSLNPNIGANGEVAVAVVRQGALIAATTLSGNPSDAVLDRLQKAYQKVSGRSALNGDDLDLE